MTQNRDDEEKNVSVSWFHSDAVSWPYGKFWKLVVHGGDRTDAIVVAQQSSSTVTALAARHARAKQTVLKRKIACLPKVY